MGIFSNAFQSSKELRSTGQVGFISNPQGWLLDFMNGNPSHSGVHVNEHTALRLTAVFAAVRVLAESLASLPLHVYKRLDSGGKQKAIDHPLYRVLHDQANDEMTSFTLRETLQAHLALWGNAYCEIERDNAGRVVALWPLYPNSTLPYRDYKTMNLYYQTVLPNGEGVMLPPERILHIPGLTVNGLVGLSPIRMAREAIGLGMSAEEYGARFFGQGGNVGGVLEHPGTLGDQARKNIRQSFTEMHEGLSKSHRLMILEEGMTYNKVGIPPEDAQFLETRKFQVTEVARLFRIPPHMLADLEHATFSNIEQQSLDFVVNTLRPWLVRWEQSMFSKLFTPTEQKMYFARFDVNDLLRGDIKSRAEALQTMRQNGIINADEWREDMDMNPQPDGQGEVYLMNAAMIPVTQAENPQQTKQPKQQDPNAQRSIERRTLEYRAIGDSYTTMFSDALKRIVKREEADVMRQAKKMLNSRDAQSFQTWLDDFYNSHPEFVQKTIEPVFRSYAEVCYSEAQNELGDDNTRISSEINDFTTAYIENFIGRYCGATVRDLKNVMERTLQNQEDLIKALQDQFDTWIVNKPDSVARRETVRERNAVKKATYIEGGVTKFKWRTVGENCPYCNHLNGKTVGISRNFVDKGDSLHPDGVDEPLKPNGNIGHPPLHRGCNCEIEPV